MITNSSLPSERYVCRIGLLERLPLRTPYPSIAARIIDIVRRLPHGQTTVIVDPTGAHAAYDMLIEKGLSPIGMTISGGDSINRDGRYVTVPKGSCSPIFGGVSGQLGAVAVNRPLTTPGLGMGACPMTLIPSPSPSAKPPKPAMTSRR
jgi:hypothetical protein